MRRIVYFIGMLAIAVLIGCGGRKHDAAYYQARIDSIRKAEQLKQLKQQAGVYDDPLDAFFDTLQVRPLPIRSAGGNISRLAHFVPLPKSLASHLGYPVEKALKVVALPRKNHYRVLMLAEEQDSLPPLLSLVTLDANYELRDQLAIYEQRGEERGDDFVLCFNEYYITSDYEVTLMFAFLRRESDNPTLESTRRYRLTDEGFFDEVVVDL